MPRTRIKICGITRPEDAALALDLGAAYVGFNQLAGPRRIDNATVDRIIVELARGKKLASASPLVALCSMSVSEYPESSTLDNVVNITSLGGSLQIYSTDYGSLRSKKEFGWLWWMVRRVMDRQSLTDLVAEVWMLDCAPSAIVLDTFVASAEGGTGQTFNWHWLAEARAAGELEGLPPIILAGGLTPDNVAEAIRIARPYAVDVSSGVEFPNQPGIKDPARLRAFIAAVRSTDTP